MRRLNKQEHLSQFIGQPNHFIFICLFLSPLYEIFSSFVCFNCFVETISKLGFKQIQKMRKTKNITSCVKIEIKGKEIEITTPNGKERKRLTISFNHNEIEIGRKQGVKIFEIQSNQVIQYQGEEYELTRDELLAIYLDLIFREIEMKWIITHVEMTEVNPTLVRAYSSP